MSNLIVSNDIYEVTKYHKKVYYINFSNVLFNHYHNNSFKINNNNSNNNLFWRSHHRGSNVTKLPAQHSTAQVVDSLTWGRVNKNAVIYNERNVEQGSEKFLWRKKNILLFRKS